MIDDIDDVPRTMWHDIIEGGSERLKRSPPRVSGMDRSANQVNKWWYIFISATTSRLGYIYTLDPYTNYNLKGVFSYLTFAEAASSTNQYN